MAGTGLLLALASGVAGGNAMLPLKFTRRWKWENTWLVFVCLALAVVPWALAVLLVKDLAAVYAGLSASQLLVPILFGAGWGIAHVLYGLSIDRLGIALGSAIVMGLVAVLGTMVPLVVQRPAILASRTGWIVISGVVLTAAGIAVSGWAGRLREKTLGETRKSTHRGGYGASLLIAVGCGVLSPMFNYAFAFGQDISAAAVGHGNSSPVAVYAVWPVALAGGLVPNLVYCFYRLGRNGSWGAFHSLRPDLLLTAGMAALWTGSFALYGMSAVFLGALGTSVGWGLTQIFVILSANASGIVAGEWTAAPARARKILWAGLSLLIVALALMAAAEL